MAELSPAAQTVLDAFRTSHTGQGCLAAALRAAALELHAKEVEIHGSSPYAPMIEVDDLLAIANEMEGT